MFQAGVKGAPPSPTRYLSSKIPWEVGGAHLLSGPPLKVGPFWPLRTR